VTEGPRWADVEGYLATTVAGEDEILASAEPYDLVFIDADKKNNPTYLEAALALTRPGSLIVIDNVVRGGRIVGDSDDPDVVGTRRVLEMLGSDPRLQATAVQTVSSKGWDGFAVALVIG
jgi:predicted O-methyltransferase YrrM